MNYIYNTNDTPNLLRIAQGTKPSEYLFYLDGISDLNTENYTVTDTGIEYTPESSTAIRHKSKLIYNNRLRHLEVQYGDYVYQADELSQSRLSKAYNVMLDTDKIKWLTKSNIIIELSKEDILQILKLAVFAQTELLLAHNQ